MPETCIYFFYGFGSAYNLGPLAVYMKEQGYQVVELNLSSSDDPQAVIGNLIGKRIRFITSYHLVYDRENFRRATGISHTSYSVLELMDLLKPEWSVFYPHDLDPFVTEYEMPWIDVFDIALLPFRNNQFYDLARRLRVEEVGLIRKRTRVQHRESRQGKAAQIIYLPSDYLLFTQEGSGGTKWMDFFEKNISKRIHIKMPPAGMDVLSDAQTQLRQNGYTLVDAKKNLFDILDDYDLVVADGASSVVTEAALSGVSVVSITNCVERDTSLVGKFRATGLVRLMATEDLPRYIDQIDGGEILLKRANDSLPLFDFERAVDLITAEW